MADASITAVIPVHNRADLMARLLATVAAQTVPFAEVVVVDNASTDNASQIANQTGCRVIAMGENAGFARAVNRGWRAADTPWIAILNSDVELDSRWVERLLAGVASHSFATGTIFSAGDRGTIDGTYDLMSRGACAWRAGNGMPAVGHSAPHPIAIAPATACLFRREVLEQLGGFDETFGSYLEDVDLGLRCLREGFTGIYVPDALAWHHGSATWGRWNPRVVRAISRNQVLLVARHYDQALLQSCLWPIVAGQLLWGLLALRHGAAFAWVQGKWEGLRQFHPQGCDSPRLRDFLTASEREIRDRAQGPYWRWYFRLTFFEKTAAH
jgi:GT2 family glycosyltransferase